LVNNWVPSPIRLSSLTGSLPFRHCLGSLPGSGSGLGSGSTGSASTGLGLSVCLSTGSLVCPSVFWVGHCPSGSVCHCPIALAWVWVWVHTNCQFVRSITTVRLQSGSNTVHNWAWAGPPGSSGSGHWSSGSAVRHCPSFNVGSSVLSFSLLGHCLSSGSLGLWVCLFICHPRPFVSPIVLSILLSTLHNWGSSMANQSSSTNGLGWLGWVCHWASSTGLAFVIGLTTGSVRLGQYCPLGQYQLGLGPSSSPILPTTLGQFTVCWLNCQLTTTGSGPGPSAFRPFGYCPISIFVRPINN